MNLKISRFVVKTVSLALVVLIAMANTVYADKVNIAGGPVKSFTIPNSSVGASASAPASLLQFRSGGHVLGFAPDRIYTVGAGYALIEEFVGAHPVQPEASGNGQAVEANGAPPLQAVTYAQLWDGITVTYEAAPAGFAQTTYRVEPHADPGRIRLRYNTDVALDADGSLRVPHPTARGYFSLSAPKAWQDVDGRRVPVRVAFTPPDGRVVGFTVGAYDTTHPLLIDPTYAWHTFQGSSANDYGYGIAADSSGNVYVTGVSSATWGEPLQQHSGGGDIVVMKFDATGVLQWHTFYGSSEADQGTGIAVDGSGHVYVTGLSSATWGTPLHQFSGYDDIVVLKLDSAGVYQWHTFYGAGTWDYGYGVAVDGAGAVLVTGTSWDSWGTPINKHGTNGWDTVVLKLGSNGTLQWNTFAGANAWNYGYGIAADDSANVYVTGKATGTWGAPLNRYSGGVNDLVVFKLNAAGAYQWHTFYGVTGGQNEGRGVAVDDDGNVFVSGTSSLEWGSPLHQHSGNTDFVVLKLDGAGTYQWHTFYGSANGDSSRAIAVDNNGQVFVTGTSWSTWGTPLHAISGYGWDLVVFALNGAGAYQWNTFYGSSATYASAFGDAGYGIAKDTTGNIYVTGASDASWDILPLQSHNGNLDIVVLKLADWAFSFIDVVDVSLSTQQVSNIITVSGIGAPESIAVAGDVSSEYAINGGAWTSASGTVYDGDTVQVRHVSAATHLTSVDTTLTIGGVSDTFTSTTLAGDATPDPFGFVDVTDVPLGTLQISNAITVAGITTSAPIAVSGAASSEYAIGDGAWTSAPGTVTNGETVRVRHTSAAGFASATNTTLTIGGVSDTFTSTTPAEDATPDMFLFPALTGVVPDTLIVSNTIAVSGINTAARIEVLVCSSSLCEYAIDGGAWTGVAGTVTNGQTVQVRQRSAATPLTRTFLMLFIGSASGTFRVTTADDTVPDAFTFVDVFNVALSTEQVSNAITVTGISAPVPIAVSGDASSQYAINGGAWTSAPGTVANGQTVRVRHTSAARYAAAVNTTLTVGGGSDTFTSVTIGDTVPARFRFRDVTDAPLDTILTSNAVTVSDITAPAPIAVSGDASSLYAINSGAWTAAPGTVLAGDRVRVRHRSATTYSTAVSTTLTIGGISDTFTSTTIGPDLTGSLDDLRLNSCYRFLCHLYWRTVLRNIGTAPSGRFEIAFYFSADRVLDPADRRLAWAWPRSVSRLVPREARSLFSYVDVPREWWDVSPLYLLAAIDSRQAVTETDETNNLLVLRLR